MLNFDAPAGKEQKYALVEFERRFLFRSIPEGEIVARRRISDRYLVNTRLRLRAQTTLDETGRIVEVVRKFTQKVPSPAGSPGLISTLYLSPEEYDALAELPASTLQKSRVNIPPLGIDVFEGDLDGLVLGEVEFPDERSLMAFGTPTEAVAEVTNDVRFAGGRLVHTSGIELAELLGEYGIRGDGSSATNFRRLERSLE